MSNYKGKRKLIFVSIRIPYFFMKKIVFFAAILLLFSCENKPADQYVSLQGLAFGTSFNITLNDVDQQIESRHVDSLIHAMNKSLSTYIPNSDISKINAGDSTVLVDALFKEVFEKSAMIYKETKGVFDPTIGTLVNAWGFGPGDKIEGIDQQVVDSLLNYVGFDKVKLEGNKVIKKHSEIYFDFNSIAKGFGVDLIGRFLEANQVEDYLIEIGGEIRARGVNSKGQPWKIAIEKPNFDGSRSFQTIISLEQESIATSGNYRKFKIDPTTGERYAHTIDTKTGYPSRSNLLSASVISNRDCADVDAYATAFMGMGFENTVNFLKNRNDLKAFLIYTDEEGKIQTFVTDNLDIVEPE